MTWQTRSSRLQKLWVFALLVAAIWATAVPRATSAPPVQAGSVQTSGVVVGIPVGVSPQAIVDASSPGTTFSIGTGVHVGFHVAPKAGDVFVGAPGTVLEGGGVTSTAFYVTNPAAEGHVTIRGADPSHLMVIQNYDNSSDEQTGTVQPIISTGQRADGWTLEWLSISGSYARGVTTSDDMLITGCHVNWNGRLGVAGTGANVTIADSEIAYNDTRNVAPGFERGGAKLSATANLVVKGNDIHDNDGPGLWLDRDAVNTLVAGNVFSGNQDSGVLVEISHFVTVSGNWISTNGTTDHPWLMGGGIVLSTSDNAQISGNLLANNGNGITAVQQDRVGPMGPRLLNNVSVHDNLILNSGLTGVGEDVGNIGVFTRQLSFVHNEYQDELFAWMDHRNLSWSAWVGFGQDPFGTWSS